MCQSCIPINKNKEQHDSAESRNKDAVSEKYEQVLNKT